jgi:hypothetical protein
LTHAVQNNRGKYRQTFQGTKALQELFKRYSVFGFCFPLRFVLEKFVGQTWLFPTTKTHLIGLEVGKAV